VFDLSQQYKTNLTGVQFFRAVEIDGNQYGVWVFEKGTFLNDGARGYEHWAFIGNHDFTDGQESAFVTFESRT
ncbi:unnamed protein product, partial [Rotaria magnacalcarata]